MRINSCSMWVELKSLQSLSMITGKSENNEERLFFLITGIQPNNKASQVLWQSMPAPSGLKTNIH